MRVSPLVGVSPGDLSPIVDGSCPAAGRAWWVESGQSTPVIANETLSGHPPWCYGRVVKSGGLSPIVDAFRHGDLINAWCVESGDTTPRITHESMRASPLDGENRRHLPGFFAVWSGAAGRPWWIASG